MTPDPVAVPDGWQVVPLGDVLTLEYGVSLPARDRLPGPIPVVGSAGVVGVHDRATNTGPGVIVGRKGSIGAVTWVASDFIPIDTTYYSVPVGTRADLRWIYHVLTREDLAGLNRATGVPGLSRDDVYALRRPVPPLAEQRALAAVLDAIDEAIERTEEVIAATERLRDALLHELLTRGLPGRHSEWADVPGLGAVPACWDVVRLGDVLSSTTYGTNVPLDGSGSTPILRMNNLQGGKIDLSEVRHAELPDRERGLNLVSGDILFNRTNSLDLVGKVAVVRDDLPQPISFASYLVRLRVRESQADGFWLASLLGSPSCQARIRRLATPAVSQANINPTSLRTLTIPLPPLDEQRAIASALDGVDGAIERAREERARLHSLQASAADALLTGRVRVGAVERVGR